MSALRIGLVSPYDLSVPGGVQAQVLGLARYLRGRGEAPLIIGPGLPDGIEGVDLGSSVSVPGNGSKVPISLDPRTRSKLHAAAADLDLLHVHEPLMPLASLFANHAGPPVVSTFHAAPGAAARFAYRVSGPLLRKVLGNTKVVTAVSATAAAVLPAVLHPRIIPNGLDVDSMKVEQARDRYRVSFLGRDEPRKGLDVLLAAWPLVVEKVPAAVLTVMGADRGVHGIEWLGRVDDRRKAEVLGSSSVFVAPQLGGESFGIVLLEAMAAGAAVVSSNLDSFVAVADRGARFFPVGDHQALGRAVIELLRDSAERERLAAIGRGIADNYDWSVVGASYHALYGEIAS